MPEQDVEKLKVKLARIDERLESQGNQIDRIREELQTGFSDIKNDLCTKVESAEEEIESNEKAIEENKKCITSVKVRMYWILGIIIGSLGLGKYFGLI